MHGLDCNEIGFYMYSNNNVIKSFWCTENSEMSLRKLAHEIDRDFSALKFENFHLKNFDIFLIFARNIDCGYRLEPPRRGGSNQRTIGPENAHLKPDLGVLSHNEMTLNTHTPLLTS